ncbi:GntR family transcriptional regulator [Foliimonas ilicis]|uniref:GntR family transcriptional regulator n=1 Tax=Mesorhizobium sp. SB112 TaxID=3151853 RepID=UPI003265C0C8
MSIPESLAETLQEEIIVGRLTSEERLTEEMVAERYGVSRSPVREALRLLERDGLVIREARRGIWVSPMSQKDFDEVYTCRIPLEGLVARQAAESANAERKAEFRTVQAELEEAQARGDVREFFTADIRGSFMIYELAENRTLSRLLEGLEKQALRYRFHAYEQNPDMIKLSLDDTTRIFDAILAGDGATAQAVTEKLIREIWQNMRGEVGRFFGK